MKNWIFTLILASIIGGGASLLLPKGEKSPFFRPVKFLSALIILCILCQPFLQFVKDPGVLEDNGFAAADESIRFDPGRLLLQRSEEFLERRIRAEFPKGEYQLVFDSDEENWTVKAIRIQTDDKELGRDISNWLTENGLARF